MRRPRGQAAQKNMQATMKPAGMPFPEMGKGVAHDSDEEAAGFITHASHTVSAAEASVRKGFLRKVFGIVGAQLLLTAAMSALFMYEPHVQQFVLTTPSLMMVAFISSLGFLCAAHANKDNFPTNLYYTFAFTVALGWSVGMTCAQFQKAGYGLLVLEAVGITGSVTTGLAMYALHSKKDFSYLGAGLGSMLWVLILGGLLAMFVPLPGFHFALAVGGAVVFSLYILYDVHMISQRCARDRTTREAPRFVLLLLFAHLTAVHTRAGSLRTSTCPRPSRSTSTSSTSSCTSCASSPPCRAATDDRGGRTTLAHGPDRNRSVLNRDVP